MTFTDLLPAYMFLVFTLLIMTGYPIAFTISATAFGFGLYAFGMGFFNLLPLRVWGVMTNFTLIAVPLFVFMGVMLERSGITPMNTKSGTAIRVKLVMTPHTRRGRRLKKSMPKA